MTYTVGRISSVGIATRYRLDSRKSNPGGGEIFSTRPDRSSAHPASYIMGTGSLSRGLSGKGVALVTHHHLEPRLKKE